MVTQLNTLPEGLLNLNARQLHEKIGNHTLVHLEGKIKRPAFISILQHGDEHTGWDALKDYLINHQNVLPRSLCILFGNVQAARYNVRQMDNQPDFNRSWPSELNLTDPIANTMREITDIMQAKKPFASVDMHNNSGRNPHYSGINSLDPQFINLASLFSDTMIYFTTPVGIQSGAFAQFCPSVTVECGLSGASDGREQTHTFLELLLSQSDLNHVPGVLEHQRIYKIVASVKVKDQIDIGYETNQHEFVLTRDLDILNFTHLKPGENFGILNDKLLQSQVMPFIVKDESNNDLTENYFGIKQNQIINSTEFVPSMITQSLSAIKHDCLCYIMKEI